MNADGTFKEVIIQGSRYRGKELFDKLYSDVRNVFLQ